MFQDTQPAALDASSDRDRWAPFRVPSADARVALLRELRDCSVPLSVSSPCGASLPSSAKTCGPAKPGASVMPPVAVMKSSGAPVGA